MDHQEMTPVDPQQILPIDEKLATYINEAAAREGKNVSELVSSMFVCYRNRKTRMDKAKVLFNEMIEAVKKVFPKNEFKQSSYAYEEGILVAIIDVPVSPSREWERRAKYMAASIERNHGVRTRVILFYRGETTAQLARTLIELGLDPTELIKAS